MIMYMAASAPRMIMAETRRNVWSCHGNFCRMSSTISWGMLLDTVTMVGHVSGVKPIFLVNCRRRQQAALCTTLA